MFYHKTKDARKIPLKDLSDEHLANIIDWQKRLSRTGLMIRSGGGIDSEDIWYDEDFVFAEEALEMLHHGKYLKEASRRGLL